MSLWGLLQLHARDGLPVQVLVAARVVRAALPAARRRARRRGQLVPRARQGAAQGPRTRAAHGARAAAPARRGGRGRAARAARRRVVALAHFRRSQEDRRWRDDRARSGVGGQGALKVDRVP